MDESQKNPNIGLGKFINSPQEQVFLSIRRHVFVVIAPLIGAIFFTLMVTIGAILLSTILSLKFTFVVEISLFSILVALIYSSKLVVDWYFHTYIVTSRKILEVSYKPFFNAIINDVLLDQVRCTEVVVKTNGIFDHLINRGDVAVCFDMPTHQDQFYFSDISSPNETGVLLGDILNTSKGSSYAPAFSRPVWYRRQNIYPHHFENQRMPNLTSIVGD